MYVAFTKDAGDRVNKLSADFPESHRLVAVDAERSLADLLATRDEMIADRDGRAAGKESPAGLEDPEYTVDIDIEQNRVVLMTPEKLDPATREKVYAEYGASTRIVEGVEPPVDLTCYSRENCQPLRAGLHLNFWDAGGFNSNCSSGFSAKHNGVKQVLSAGHCTNHTSGQNVQVGGTLKFGTVGQSADGQRVDALRAGVTVSGFNARGWVYQNPDHKGRQVSNVNSYSALMVGTPVGKSGYTTNMTWGAISSKYLSPPGYVDLISADEDAFLGDSGGALVKQANWAAVGIVKAVILGYSENPAIEGHIIHSHVQFVENRLGVNIITDDGP